MTNLAGIVRDAEAARGEWLAVRQGELALTYSELRARDGQAAALLREAGVGPGDRVGADAAERAGVPDGLLRHPGAPGAVGGADEPAAEEPGGRVLPGRLRREGHRSPGTPSAGRGGQGRGRHAAPQVIRVDGAGRADRCWRAGSR